MGAYIPKRMVFTLLAFIGFVFNYTLRVSYSFFCKSNTAFLFLDQHELGDHIHGEPDSIRYQGWNTQT